MIYLYLWLLGLVGLALEPGQHRGHDHGDPDHHPGDLCPTGDCVGVDAGGDQVDVLVSQP